MVQKRAVRNSGKDADRLFCWGVLVSVLIHGAVFVWGGDHFPPQATGYIELEVLPPAPPAARRIPRPPREAPPPATPAAPACQPVAPVPRLPAAAIAPAAVPAAGPKEISVPVAAPSVPALPALRAAVWQPPPAVPAESAAFGSQRDYFEMVRRRVEHNKRYPDFARKRQLEGRVGVRFVIAADGRLRNVMLVKRAAAETLNQAALAAVRAAEPFPRPPDALFNGPISLELSIVFELM